MKLHIFQSAKGDCLLLESADGKRVLCDGGMATSMRQHVRAELAKLARLDQVYISHIDQDHISGVLQLLEDALEWKLFDHHANRGTPIAAPDAPRPPPIGGLWHNALRDQVEDNAGRIEDLLAAMAPSLLASEVPELVAVGAQAQEIAVSVPEAIRVSRYASPELLGIPINRLPGSAAAPKLLMRRAGQAPFDVGSMRFTILGPGQDELDKLRRGWNNFLDEDPGRIDDLREQIRRKVDAFGTEAIDLRRWQGIAGFKGVSVPNIASLMFMVEEDGKRLLLTGDSQQEFILTGLRNTGFLANAGCHVDVLKVQHHGSENNVDAEFCRQVSADHYVFCGNGFSTNPNEAVLKIVRDSRLGDASKRALAPAAARRPFTFWFSTTSDRQLRGSDQQKQFAKVEKTVRNLVAQSGGRMTATFNEGASITLEP